MKKVFKVILKVIIYLLIFTTLITGFVIVSRNNNQAKIDKQLLVYKSHPRLTEMGKPSPENIGMTKKKIIGDSIRGFHYVPNEILHKGVVVTFGGSEGSMNEYMANYLSSDGYEVFAVYYFGQHDLPDHNDSIAIEIYEEIYSYIQDNCKDPSIITILGASKGAKLALLMSTYYDTIDNLVLFAPSAYVMPATNLNEESQWTYKGQELDYLNGAATITMIKNVVDLLLNKPYEQVKLMNNKFNNSTNFEESRIKVENSNAKMLLFYGEDDRMIDSKYASKIIEEYAKNQILIHGYENVGHSFGAGYVMEVDLYINLLNGGDVDSNIEADLDSKRVLLQTLELWHK